MSQPTIIYRNQEYLVEARIPLSQALHELGILPETVLAVRDGVLITENEMVNEGDSIKLISVISGGGIEIKREK